MKISYAITCCNEVEETKRLVSFLLENKREEDEIVMLWDSKNGDDNIKKEYDHNIHISFNIFEFDGNFAEFKNELNDLCLGDFIIQLDADEMISKGFLEVIPLILENNPEVDFYWVPRENYVDGLTQEYIDKWGWRVDNQNRVNYPDYQGRIYRNDDPNIMWSGKVHEQIVGYKRFTKLPSVPELSIIHKKTIDKQVKQNDLYSKI